MQTFFRIYSKRFVKLGLVPPPDFDAKARQWAADDEVPLQLHMSSPMGPNATAIIFESLKRAGIKSLRSIRLWKCDIQNEGTRVLSEVIKSNAQLEVLDLLDNGISELGCEFLSRALERGCQVRQLFLDHNPVGDTGLSLLAKSLAVLPNLEELSLAFCGLKQGAAPSIQQILLYRYSHLETLNIAYNSLGNGGCYDCLRAAEISLCLKQLSLRHNDIIEDAQLGGKLLQLIEENTALIKLDLSCNNFSSPTAEGVCDAMLRKLCIHVDLGDDFPPLIVEKLRAATARVQASTKRGKGAKKRPKSDS